MLNGKRVLISGAGGLLGTRLVERLLSENSIVIAADLDVELLRERLKAIGISEHSSLSLEKLDLNDSEEVMFFFNALPCLDGAVNCAYPRNKQYGRKFFDVELKDFNENLSSTWGLHSYLYNNALNFLRNTRRHSLL